MKNKVKGLMVGLLIGSLITGTAAFAATGGKKIEAFFNIKDVKVNKVSSMPKDKPFQYNGETYIPTSLLTSALKIPVKYDRKTSVLWIGQTDQPGTAYIGKDLKDMNYQEGDSFHKATWGDGTVTEQDNLGNNYTNFLKLYIEAFYANKEFWNYIEYPLNGQFKKFNAKISFTEKYKSSRETATLIILLDGEEAFKGDYKAGEFPMDIEVDVTNAAKMTVKVVTTGKEGVELGLFEPKMTK